MHGPPRPPITERRRSRGRAISSSSGTSCEVPKTPQSEDHRLGRDFSILKMRVSEPSVAGADMFAVDAFREPGMNKPKEHLPPWLRGTISSLAPKHPLRLLAPGQSALHGDSSPSALDLSSDSLPTPVEETPFAFVAPVIPSRKTSPPALSAYSTYGDLEPSVLLHESAGISRTLLDNNHIAGWSPRAQTPLAASLRPFSTPGPASGFTLEQNPVPLPLQLSEQRFPTETSATRFHSLDRDEPHPNFLPFSTPGSLCSPPAPSASFHPNRNTLLLTRNRDVSPPRFLSSPGLSSPLHTMPASGEKNGPSPSYSPVTDTRLGISSDTSRPSSGPLQPRTLGFKPFATPGPAHLLSSPVVTRDPHCPRPPPARLPPKPLYSNELERDPRPPYTFPPSPIVEPPQRNAAPCDVPEFRWERFDRSNPQLALSSSPVRVAAESEETFWSQPAQAILGASSPSQRHDASPAFSPHTPPRDALPYSPSHSHPAQLRDAFPQASPADLPRTPVSQDHAPDEGQDPDDSQEDSGGDGLFAWIVAPRDQPAPSTPRRRLADPRTELGPTPTTPMSGPAQGSSGRGRVVSSPDAIREGSPPTPPCGPSFAPAPGIYISPLRGEDEDTPVPIETNPRSSDLRPNSDAVKTEVSRMLSNII